jgi:hypothetical protein
MRQVHAGRSIAALAFAPALFLGACDRTLTPTAADLPRAEFSFTNGPPTAGPFVVRLADAPVFYFSADEQKDIMSIHIPLDVTFCGGSAPRNLADIQFVTTPSEVQRVLALIKDDDGAVQIYGTADFTEAFGPGGPFSDVPHLCAFMNGPKKIAEGTARRVSAFSGESFSVNWTGTLVDATGNPVRYSEHQVFVMDPHTGERTITTSAIHLGQ